MEIKDWKVRREDKITTLSLNTHKKGNVVAPTTFLELREILQSIKEDQDCWCVVIDQGDEEHFSYGMDINEVARSISAPPNHFYDVMQELQYCLLELENLEKPTVISVKGKCIGAAFLLSFCCDFRIVGEGSVFSLPEVQRCMAVIMGTSRVVRLAGEVKAKEWMMLGQPVPAEELHQLGLLYRHVPLAQVSTQTQQLTSKLVALPPAAVSANKKIIQHVSGMESEDTSLDKEIFEQAALLNSADFKEAVTCFLEKRLPLYTGK